MALVELGRFSYPEAHLLVARLAAEGLMAFAFDAGTHLAEGSAGVIPVRVMVDDEDLETAVAIRDGG
ncbi:MAG: DUF2007 domain-containing protein [Sphingomonas sp.]